jgi:DNA-binding CsgD family transcriptional regulator
MRFPSGHHRPDASADASASFVLTPREREMLTLLAAGLSAVEIAEQLVISRETVKSHVRSAMLKLGARTRTHAVVRALACGEITLLYSGIPSETRASADPVGLRPARRSTRTRAVSTKRR